MSPEPRTARVEHERKALAAIKSHVFLRREMKYQELIVCLRCGCSLKAARHFGWRCDKEKA